MAPSSLPAGRQVSVKTVKYYLYILENKDKRHYFGISHDIKHRLQEHNSGQVRSTKFYKPWRIIYSEVYENRADARKREVILKINYNERIKVIKI